MMKQYKFKSALFTFVLSTLVFLSCTNKQPKDETPTYTSTEDQSKLDTISIVLNSNDRMQFDTQEIVVFEGQTVILTLRHTGTMPATAMGHNFVLLDKGISISKFAKEALKAKDNQYIPIEEKNVIAYTKMIGGGESTSVTFDAPEKGTYDFLCSFPGHYSIMKGKFNVK